jgi:ankyrin repeat protein
MSNEIINAILEKCASTGLFVGETPLEINEPNIFGDTPLHLVCGWDDVEAVAALLAADAKVNAIGDRGQTPLFRAGSVQVASLLMAAGADPTIKDALGESAETFLRNVGAIKVADYISSQAKRPRE